ncbi:MAG: hypothetical protein QOG42_1883, partial [Solirubrobacteraceae bacterium]|nr:hypothetical protein [Solirubrobacteraceae bacterium]
HAAFDPQPWLDRGVEFVDEPLDAWLADRPLSFDAVVACGRGAEDVRDQLRATQPQARIVRLPEDRPAGGVPAETLAAAGLAPPLVRAPRPLARTGTTGIGAPATDAPGLPIADVRE